MIRKPSDLGYSDDGFILPELRIHENVVKTAALSGFLFPLEARSLQERQAARRESVDVRIDEADRIIREHDPDGQWLVWTNLNLKNKLNVLKMAKLEDLILIINQEDREDKTLPFLFIYLNLIVNSLPLSQVYNFYGVY